MSAITKEQNAKVSEFFNKFWKECVKPNYNPEPDNKDYWTGLIDMANKLGDEYAKNDPVIRGLVMGYLAGLEEQSRNINEVKKSRYVSIETLLNPLNRMYKAVKEENMDDIKSIMKELMDVYQKAQKIEMANGSVTAAVAFGGKNG